MFRVFFVVALLMAAILSYPAVAGNNIGRLGDAEEPEAVPIVIGPAGNVQLPPDARVWIDESLVALGGNYGDCVKGLVMNQLRDQAFTSGRHGVSFLMKNTKQVITHKMMITGAVNIGEKQKGGVLILPVVGTLFGKDKLVASADITLTIYEVKSNGDGKVVAVLHGVASAEKTIQSGGAIVVKNGGVAKAEEQTPDLAFADKAVCEAIGQVIAALPACTLVMPECLPEPAPSVSLPIGGNRGGLREGEHLIDRAPRRHYDSDI